MKTYVLAPKAGWEKFKENKALGDEIYALLGPLVNNGVCKYFNFTSDTGSFEDELGNALGLEFKECGEELSGLILNKQTSAEENEKTSELVEIVNGLKMKYNLGIVEAGK